MSETRNPAKPESENLPRLVVLLHWLLAASVFFLFISSWWMLSLPLPSEEFTYRELPFQLHKNIGITLFVAVITMTAMRQIAAARGELVSRLVAAFGSGGSYIAVYAADGLLS